MEGTLSYVIHYGDANDTNPDNAKYLGYTTGRVWLIGDNDLPSHEKGDRFTFWVQAFDVRGRGVTDTEKAQYLINNYLGSDFSDEATVSILVPLTLVVNGVEESGDYEVLEISQADYLVLLANGAVDPDIVYSVTPEGSES